MTRLPLLWWSSSLDLFWKFWPCGTGIVLSLKPNTNGVDFVTSMSLNRRADIWPKSIQGITGTGLDKIPRKWQFTENFFLKTTAASPQLPSQVLHVSLGNARCYTQIWIWVDTSGTLWSKKTSIWAACANPCVRYEEAGWQEFWPNIQQHGPVRVWSLDRSRKGRWLNIRRRGRTARARRWVWYDGWQDYPDAYSALSWHLRGRRCSQEYRALQEISIPHCQSMRL